MFAYFPRKPVNLNTAADPWCSADNHKQGAGNRLLRHQDTRRIAFADQRPPRLSRSRGGFASFLVRGAPIGLRLVVLNYLAWQILKANRGESCFPLITSLG